MLCLAGAEIPRAISLPTEAADPVLEPMLIVQSFYRMVNASRWRADSTPISRPISIK